MNVCIPTPSPSISSKSSSTSGSSSPSTSSTSSTSGVSSHSSVATRRYPAQSPVVISSLSPVSSAASKSSSSSKSSVSSSSRRSSSSSSDPPSELKLSVVGQFRARGGGIMLGIRNTTEGDDQTPSDTGRLRTTRNPPVSLCRIGNILVRTGRPDVPRMAEIPAATHQAVFLAAHDVLSLLAVVLVDPRRPSWHHSNTLPCMSNRPNALGMSDPTGKGPSCGVDQAAGVPQEQLIGVAEAVARNVVPARQAYSHSVSRGRRYPGPGRGSPPRSASPPHTGRRHSARSTIGPEVRPSRSLSQLQYATASYQLTSVWGKSGSASVVPGVTFAEVGPTVQEEAELADGHLRRGDVEREDPDDPPTSRCSSATVRHPVSPSGIRPDPAARPSSAHRGRGTTDASPRRARSPARRRPARAWSRSAPGPKQPPRRRMHRRVRVVLVECQDFRGEIRSTDDRELIAAATSQGEQPAPSASSHPPRARSRSTRAVGSHPSGPMRSMR